ncbi:PREDICTED: squamosa promoter-binding-like protein 1 [Lupinus angustifolius]|uniref:squamosa promoter-binding-like protein 1 n=1 Tax=Lupinus angustifolius TaxID=3871 RepID=UPI00092F6D3C|nr:PREDICTED: squamosa promoter-binding-like protein 1 [Lupinus angustifolius]XP_019414800.1 PREDICTED: squamosa promoter-binding-like protein 1 [Lupinus angustifolius]XP_019414802.1 PREDICTED: squamosa promoter-binding-like protein 1 [Lupinus angustifolius]XP_019414803.1 PREDICTED: squamosa promoter-binding-like protein 1 [Lupinus angustifolius]XP_019414804.1 PREDICTED: squamosa promoter-binding-like protein 1 [Lupinus angustifolius]XP_019414805.1 PREDICTED: squamosa promoter-binding-like pro
MVPEMKAFGKRSLEWDLNDWKWDGDLFTATPLNPVPSDWRSQKLFPVDPEIPANGDSSNNFASHWDGIEPGEGNNGLEKMRRGVGVVVAEGVELNNEGSGFLNLNLGAQVYPTMEGEETGGKKMKVTGTTSTSNRAVCQVEDCRADLSNAKDYHRRHKVCDVHSKASRALVGNVMQRFCQQCSRFHILQEFDEGKRSCRRRLAGHNKRRRKTHPDPTVSHEGSLNDEKGSSYLLMSLLRILSNMHSNNSDHTRNQDVLSNLLRNLASVAGTINGSSITSLLEGSHDLVKAGTSAAAQNVPTTNSNGPIHEDPPESRVQCESVPAYDMSHKCISLGNGGIGSSKPPSGPQSASAIRSRDSVPPQSVAAETTVRKNGLNNIDLNNVYDDLQDNIENPWNSCPPAPSGIGSLDHPLCVQRDSLRSSPPQTSRNSDSTSTQSPSCSSGEAQCRTDRIIFKLFGEDPKDLPLVLRSKILSWLSHSPTEIESYIRPGCIILTVYLRLENSAWEELCYNLGSSLRKLLAASNDSFWRTGWVYARVQHSVAFLHNGEVVLDVPLHLKSRQNCQILCVKPLAVSSSSNAQFTVKGFNLFLTGTRLLCALEGKYLVQDSYDFIDSADTAVEHDEIQQVSFSCHVPNVTGRGFIEVEDNGLSNCSFPFIVAEQEICSEICKLDNVIEAAEAATEDIQVKTKLMEEKTRALYFIQEMGWLLHRCRVKVRLGSMTPVQDHFHFSRFKWLVGFSMDHDWCAVIKKLLDIIFDGVVGTGEHSSVELALLDLGLLHRAVKRSCKPMVELLLRFVPVKASDGGHRKETQVDKSLDRFLFRPDAVGPAGLTPLHVAASMNGSENILDALTDDQGMVGIEAWKSARDDTGLTPYDYASLRGFYSYIHLVQRKTRKKHENQHVLDIPGTLVDCNIKQKQSDGHRSSKVSSLQTEKIETTATTHHCGQCQRKLAYGSGTRKAALVYRPAMLSMVAIAAVCVCVALLFKSSPRVDYVFQPFSWESLKYGSM